jgi:hypothetical protein
MKGNKIMTNISRHNGILRILRRERSSANGNPRYFLQVARVTCYTAIDSSLGYSVTNYDGKEVIATIGTHYGRPTLDSITIG